MESLHYILNHFTDETISISLAVLILVSMTMIAYWWYNRRRFHQLKHQIPASVLKNYLDSIIANSNALKSSLFRGGGLEIGEGIPSIVPTGDLPIGNVSDGASAEEIARKNAEISSLKATITQKESTIVELEKMLEAARAGNGGEVSAAEVKLLNDEIEKLKAELAAAPSGGGGDPAELVAVTKERDDLKERLMEYEIIEEDLANLKKFQQENEELKKKIAELGGEVPAAAEPEPVAAAPAPEPVAEPEPTAAAEPEPEPAPEPAAEEPTVDDIAAAAPVEAAAGEDAPAADEGEQKSAEELLSEFEKMLG